MTTIAVLLVLALTPGTYSNEEEVYFDGEAGRAAAPWTGVLVADDNQAILIDRFGKRVGATVPPLMQGTPDALTMVLPDGHTSNLRRARPATCWGSVPKSAKKPDGSDGWYFAPGLKLHDQGGRVRFGGPEAGTPEVVLRMRNVIWPTGTNKPSLVLYVHKPESPDRAEAYSWADPDAKRIGINLRWMQASCTIDTLEKRK
jgi:hypothetical protein